MDRRAFVTGTLAVVAMPLGAGAQQAAKPAKIGLLSVTTPAVLASAIEVFRQALLELGHVEGKTFVLEPRYGEGRFERLSELARELVGLKVGVIVATSDVVIAALKRETQTIPIVMVISTDPVGTGFVASLARPGRNITGLSNISPELSGKRLELLREAVPGLSRVAALWNPDIRGAVLDYKETEGAARLMGLELQSVEVSRAEDLDRAFSAVTNQRVQALVLPGANPVGFMNRGKIATFAQRSRLPVMYPTKEYVDAGGLMSYGPSLPDLFRHAATYVDKILKGAKPADLPVEQPTKFELVINVKAAKAIGLTIPQTLLQRADQIIEQRMLDQRGHLLRAAAGFATCPMPSYDRALWALRTWLDSQSGIRHVAVGMHRQGYDLQFTQYDERGWRATFYTTGMEHSPTSATGSGWERTPWHAVQGAAWEALKKVEVEL